MKTKLFIFVALFSFLSCKESATSKIKSENVAIASARDQAAKKVPVITFEKTEHDFGVINQNENQSTIFKFTNTGNAPLVITSASSTCGCTVPKTPKDPILPGESGELEVRFNGAGTNQVSKQVTVNSNTAKGIDKLTIKAFVNPKNGSEGSLLKVTN
ncbi:MAG: DUF1573 domain-containing protein [Flavobacteriaceae bacterium]|nr:DUF1573 domain-containing protein [Flavobacteriaceae bacterium]